MAIARFKCGCLSGLPITNLPGRVPSLPLRGARRRYLPDPCTQAQSKRCSNPACRQAGSPFIAGIVREQKSIPIILREGRRGISPAHQKFANSPLFTLLLPSRMPARARAQLNPKGEVVRGYQLIDPPWRREQPGVIELRPSGNNIIPHRSNHFPEIKK